MIISNIFSIGSSDPLLVGIHKFRYSMYGTTKNIIDISKYDDCMEYDRFDIHSSAIGIYDKQYDLLGCGRIVFPDDDRVLPFQEHCKLSQMVLDILDLNICCEISRVIVKQSISSMFLRKIVLASIIKAAFEISKENNIKYCFMVLEPLFIRLLERFFDIKLTTIGDSINLWGIRTPCMISVDYLEKNITKLESVLSFNLDEVLSCEFGK